MSLQEFGAETGDVGLAGCDVGLIRSRCSESTPSLAASTSPLDAVIFGESARSDQFRSSVQHSEAASALL